MYHESLLRKARESTVRALLIGAGKYGLSFVFQARRVPGLKVVAVCDSDLASARAACRHAGFAEADIHACGTRAAALAALAAGCVVVSQDAAALIDTPIDVVIDATGSPEGAARHAELARQAGKHMVMVSKEADTVVGPLLHAKAAAAGLVYTPVDGDQPSLLMQLVMWARVVGLEVLCAGKSSEYDFVYDKASAQVTCLDRTSPAAGLEEFWELGTRDAFELAAGRARLLSAIPQHTVPDLVEMGLVANALGLKPDVAEFHAPISRPIEIADLLATQDRGGLLRQPGVVDVVNCLRRPDEASLAGGVFVVVGCDDGPSWEMLRAKGHIVSRNGRAAAILRPSHLLGAESATTVLMAALERRSSGPADVKPLYDVCGRTTRALSAGTVLSTAGPHHTIAGVEGVMLPAQAVQGANPVPYYQMAGCRLLKDVPAGAVIPADAVEPPQDSALWALRREMDATFFGNAPPGPA